MSEVESLRNVAAKAAEVVLRWTDGEAARTFRVTELGAALLELEAAEMAAGTWEETHA